MLVAINEDRQILNLLDIDRLKMKDLKSKKFRCPACKGQVYLKYGSVRAPHFAHVSTASCQYASEHESYQHLSLKSVLYHWFSETETVQVEQFLKKIQQRPDLLINASIAVEIQCSPLSVKRLRERTNSYHRNGYTVLWLMGEALWLGDYLSELKQHFLYFSESAGFYYWELDIKAKQIRLNYLIHQDLTGQLHYLVKTFAFGSDKLLDILRTPFKGGAKSLKVQLSQDISRYIARQLYYKHSKWLKVQEIYYKNKQNLLTVGNLPNVIFPVGLNRLTYQFEGVVLPDYCQLTQDVRPYYRHFISYHQTRPCGIVYPPRVYSARYQLS
ncbi:Competence protein CoiA [Lactococcus piscium]|uniref:Competence protein CoiA n=1 Tax=Pseudolactococcus piscium TaxID=1364 RepID=A0A2A5S046_9LACT|nr:competence protein CoiA family protein [Lactococcus piscium]PCS06768.1 Competence protein CoiA [Lactococcus piscium]